MTLPGKTSISTPNKIAIVLVVGLVLTVLAMTALTNRNDGAEQTAAAATAKVVREDSRRLSTAKDEKAVLVEFLDFECESCLAAYPFVEEMREKYRDHLTIVSRYFPLPGHANSLTAAVAVEAAAQQEKFDEMYHRLFETQTQWAHSQESQVGTFRGYAEDLGLDMAAYDAAVADPGTTARVEADKNDGLGLGVTGTPTFFLEGEQIAPTTLEEFEQLIKAAVLD
ncbi:MAG: DsbA family protein [Actinomycetota bacterium]